MARKSNSPLGYFVEECWAERHSSPKSGDKLSPDAELMSSRSSWAKTVLCGPNFHGALKARCHHRGPRIDAQKGNGRKRRRVQSSLQCFSTELSHVVVPRRLETNKEEQIPIKNPSKCFPCLINPPFKIGSSTNLKKIGCNVSISHGQTDRLNPLFPQTCPPLDKHCPGRPEPQDTL